MKTSFNSGHSFTKSDLLVANGGLGGLRISTNTNNPPYYAMSNGQPDNSTLIRIGACYPDFSTPVAGDFLPATYRDIPSNSPYYSWYTPASAFSTGVDYYAYMKNLSSNMQAGGGIYLFHADS
jgi:hypothetical protein